MSSSLRLPLLSTLRALNARARAASGHRQISPQMLRRAAAVITVTVGSWSMAVAADNTEHAKDGGKDHGRPNAFLDKTSSVISKLRADADMQSVLDAHADLKPRAIEKLSVEEARRNPNLADAVNNLLQKKGQDTRSETLVPGVRSEDRSIQGAVGSLPARIYTPEGQGPFPVIVYFHGGGWVIADKQVYDASARGLAKQARAVVVSVDYRQAPEHKFPAAWDDALAAYKWAVKEAASIQGDPGRVALAGESAGGNLAVATAIAARDAGLPKPAHVLAIYPVAQTSLNTESYIENAIAKPLNRAMVQWFVDKTSRSGADLADPRLDLVSAKLEGLPPVTIINARIDPLRSDGAKLADALKKARVPVERRDFAGVTHEFFGLAAVVQKARDAQAYAGQRLQSAFGTSLGDPGKLPAARTGAEAAAPVKS